MPIDHRHGEGVGETERNTSLNKKIQYDYCKRHFDFW